MENDEMPGARAMMLRMLLWVGVLCVAQIALTPSHALASVSCGVANGASQSVQNLIAKVHTADRAGGGTLSVRDVLIGVSDVGKNDQAALDARGPILLRRNGDGRGTVVNDGPTDQEVQGIFAGNLTYFKVPRNVQGNYASSPDSAAFFYSADHAMEFGESVFGFRLFRVVNHIVVTADKISVFFGDNTGPDPDRCYAVPRA